MVMKRKTRNKSKEPHASYAQEERKRTHTNVKQYILILSGKKTGRIANTKKKKRGGGGRRRKEKKGRRK